MRILFDHNVPKYLRHLLKGHQVSTARREGWDELSNGRLLDAAERAGFELMVTMDRNIPQEQNLSGRRISLAMLRTTTQDKAAFLSVFGRLIAVLPEFVPGSVVSLSA